MVEAAKMPRTALDHYNNWESALLLGGVTTYLLGKKFAVCNKMNNAFSNYWVFDDFAKVVSSTYVASKEISSYFFSGRDAKAIKNGDNKNAPCDEYPLNNVGPRVAARLTATALKMFSAGVLVQSGLSSIGILQSGPSVRMRVIGATAGIAGLAADITDLELRKKEYKPSTSLLKRNAITGDDFNAKYELNLHYQQAIKVCIIGIKLMGLMTALSEIESLGLQSKPLIGRVLNNSNGCWNTIFAVLAGTTLAQKIHVKADLDKNSKKKGSSVSKFFFEDFLVTRTFVRIINAGASQLADLEYETLGGVDLGKLAKFSKSFDDFIYIPSAIASAGKMYDKYDKGLKIWDGSKEEKWNGVHAIIKFAGDFFGALKYIASFQTVAYFSSRFKGLGYLKNGFKSTAAVMTIVQEAPGIWNAKKGERILPSAKIAVACSSLFLNGFGGLESVFGSKILPPVANGFKPWVYTFAKVNACLFGTIRATLELPERDQ